MAFGHLLINLYVPLLASKERVSRRFATLFCYVFPMNAYPIDGAVVSRYTWDRLG